MFCWKLDGSYTLTNAEGQFLCFDVEKQKQGEVAYSSDMPEWDIMQGIPQGFFIDMSASHSFTLEADSTYELDVRFYGSNSSVYVRGTNIEKVKIDADGTITLYGADMIYTVKIKNEAHILEYSASGSDDVILRVVDKQLVEVVT